MGLVTSGTASVEQTSNVFSTLTENVSSLTARTRKTETIATSVSSGSDSARAFNVLGPSNGSAAAGSLGSYGPGSSDVSRNTRRRLDTFSSTEDEQARSAISLRFFFEQYHKGTAFWINNLCQNPTCQSTTNLSELIARQVLCRQDSYSKLEPNVRTLARCNDDGIPCEKHGSRNGSRELLQW